MPTEIFEDGLDVYIGLLEAEPIALGPSYPFPRLRPTGEEEMRTFRTILLENPYLRVTIVPALGGRILSLFDKRTGTEILRRHPSLEMQAGGRRGVTIREGISLRLDGEDRLNALGNVATAPDEAADEESPGGVWLAETALANGFGFHLHVSLPPDRAEVRFEARIHNRTFEPLPYDGELALYMGDGDWSGTSFYSVERDAGLALFTEDFFDGARFEDGTIRFARFGENRVLAPRQVDNWSVTLVPLSGLGGLSAASPEAAAFLGADALRVQTVQERRGHKLVLLTQSGQTLEAPAELYPEHVLEIPLEGLPSAPEALVLMDAQRDEVLRVPTESGQVASPNGSLTAVGDWPSPEDEEGNLRRATFDPATRYLAYASLAVRALSEKEFPAADTRFEQSLMFNADDPLLWWGKALARRSAGVEDERPELLNAHYLAPLEPALRAEAFLAQSMEMGKEPSPLLTPLDENPEEFVEVACLLIEHGQLDQASRWIDEALRHREMAMLHLLMADCLLRGTRMVAEAAEHVAAAGRAAGPPYPWRKVEIEALHRVSERFPNNEHLRELMKLARS